MFVLSLTLYLGFQINFNGLQIPSPQEFVNDNFIAHINEHFITYCSALAGITAIKYLLRI